MPDSRHGTVRHGTYVVFKERHRPKKNGTKKKRKRGEKTAVRGAGARGEASENGSKKNDGAVQCSCVIRIGRTHIMRHCRMGYSKINPGESPSLVNVGRFHLKLPDFPSKKDEQSNGRL